MACYSEHVSAQAYIAPNATILGEVHIADGCTVLFNATLRGDCGQRIVIGRGSNVQENVCMHVAHGHDTIVGESVTVGHGAILHGCDIGDNTIVGMGSVVIDGARVGRNCLIGAGALVTGTADIPEGSLVLGSPARAVRALTEEEIASLAASAEDYRAVGKDLCEQGVLLTGGEA